MSTLGDLLNTREACQHVREAEWVQLVRSIARGDRSALHALYERAHRIVFRLGLGLTGTREAAGKLTRDVFHDLWRGASAYDRANGTVLGWILNRTRSRAMDPPWVETWNTHVAPRDGDTSAETAYLPIDPWIEPDWKEVAPGISSKLLAIDAESERISMLVRLAPGTHYPPHRHADVEELHLLDGELWIDYRKLVPGDSSRREAGTEDHRVWSKTGCTCFLMTSAGDELR